VTRDGRAGYGAKARRKIVGNDLAMIFPGTMSSLNPCFTVGWQIRDPCGGPFFGIGPRANVRNGLIELFDRSVIPDPEKAAVRLPHQMVGAG